MSSPRTLQQFITVRGRRLHFVAYDAQPGNPRRGIEAVPAMWCMMAGLTRCPVMAFDPAQPEADRAKALERWAEHNAFGAAAPVPQPQPQPHRGAGDRWEE